MVSALTIKALLGPNVACTTRGPLAEGSTEMSEVEWRVGVRCESCPESMEEPFSSNTEKHFNP